MALNLDKNLKLYYSIGEVAEMFNINESHLRYWEKEFRTFLKPHKSSGGTRQYTKEDIEDIRLVYHLVKEQGMTIAGARQKLKLNKQRVVLTAEITERLTRVKEELLAMKKELDVSG